MPVCGIKLAFSLIVWVRVLVGLLQSPAALKHCKKFSIASVVSLDKQYSTKYDEQFELAINLSFLFAYDKIKTRRYDVTQLKLEIKQIEISKAYHHYKCCLLEKNLLPPEKQHQ